ncbi:MAG: glycerol-3-phosphate 1-O-acyltransferase PlsY [Lachnospiraceae bacterium]|nr:glycerol-3-phosphate 1-O-acyltransferase PlsY [Lachnospiraceae bacterium]
MTAGLLCRAAALIIGYAFGLFQTAYIVGKAKGIDIRNYGSGNSGTTNALRVMGSKAGIIVFLVDMLKGILAILTVQLILGRIMPELVWVLKMYAFAGCVLGHNYPFYMSFRGGKGVAVAGGFAIAYHPLMIPFALAAFLVPFAVTHFVSLGSLLLYTVLFIFIAVGGAAGLFAPSTPANIAEILVIFGIFTVMVFVRHRTNIRRLLNGTENKTYLVNKKGSGK